MLSHVDTDTLLIELDQRHHQAAMQRLATTCSRGQERHAGRLRWTVGTVLLRAGGRLLGEDAVLGSGTALGSAR